MLDQDDIHPLFYGAPDTTEFRKLRKRIVRLTREAIETYGMARAGERWLVCLSGGKDSYTLLAALTELKWRGLLPVEILACNLDQGQPGFPATVLPEFLTRMGVPHRIEYRDTYSVVVDKVPAAKTYCALCSRLRRGQPLPDRPGGGVRGGGARASPGRHHRDVPAEPVSWRQAGGDAAEAAQRRRRPHVLRPLAHVPEADCARFAKAMGYPIIPCDLCGSQDGLQRAAIKRMVDEWEARSPGAAANPVPGADAR